MIDTKALRSRVLDLAIQGKLTEQLESDGTAEELCKSLGLKIKETAVPFSIPNNWIWCKGKDCFRPMETRKPTGDFFEYIDIDAIDNKKLAIKQARRIPTSDAPSRASRAVFDGSVLFSLVRPYLHNIAFVSKSYENCIASTGFFVATSNGLLYPDYLYYLMISDYVVMGLNQYMKGDNSPSIRKGHIEQWLFPIPPLAEQKRIVARVEEIFRLLDTIDAAQEQYAADAESLKAKLITLGIQGRLTEQLESDGTAEELYQQIQAEKQRLFKEGRIKREKPLPEIKPEEVPFEIPGNWKWVYLGEIFQHNTGKALNSANADGKLLEYITTSNVYWDRFELKSLKQMRFTEDEIEKCTIKKGDLLICEGGDIGRSAIWCFDYDMRIQNHLHRLRGYKPDICVKYYYYLMWLYKATGKIDGRGIGLQGFSSKRVHSLIVPLPPLAEQKRIAETLERVLGVL